MLRRLALGFAGLLLVFAFFTVTNNQVAGRTAISGVTTGMMVRNGSGFAIGTVFVAEVSGGPDKFLCTAEDIANLANEYGVVKIDPGLVLQGDFAPVGSGDGERIFCAPVNTNWPAFQIALSSKPPEEAVIPLSDGDYKILETNQEEGGGLVSTGWRFQPYHIGSPITDGRLVFGVLSGFKGDTGYFTFFPSP